MNERCDRVLQCVLILMTLFVIVSSLYFQYVKGLQPCPLCLMQRLCACALLISLSLGLFIKRMAVVFAQCAFAFAGVFFALRQLWLQLYAVHDATACMPGLDLLIKLFPWREVVHVFFWGSNACSEVTWYGLGLSMAAWSALYFSAVLFLRGLVLMGLVKCPPCPPRAS